ncbi:MAG: hypothetical protein HC908_08520 [Calothrix sp. SM1_7_51]|nr:hypothetical protein [Calothrix sp. SM1_7_51]
MKIKLFSLTKLVLATLAGASLLMPVASFANPTGAQPLPDLSGDSSNRDPMSGRGDFNVFQLIHNANFGSLNQNFATEQKQQIDDATTAFRVAQQCRIQQQLLQANPNDVVAAQAVKQCNSPRTQQQSINRDSGVIRLTQPGN